jgi:hypothetical protein
MKTKPPYERIVTKASGSTCNICRQALPLTEDHVPPRSCLIDVHVEIEPFEHRLRSDQAPLPWSQNGVRFKTICGTCNSLLGGEYDPALAHLCKEAMKWLNSPLTLGDRWKATVDPARLIRCLFGHMLAASSIDPDTAQDRAMREFFLGQCVTPAPATRVMYWLHPHRFVGVLRSIAMPARRGHFSAGFGVFCLLKVPPLAFLITDLDEYEGLPRLDTLAQQPGEVEVRFWKGLARERDWPERVDEGNFIMVGASAKDARNARPLPKRG